MPTHREQTSVIVSVNLELDEEARFQSIEKQVGQGFRVLSAIPLSGGELGPGGESETFQRMLVHLERLIDEDNVIVQGAGSALTGDAAARNAAWAASQLPDERTPDAAANAPGDDRGADPRTSASVGAAADVSSDV